ncbi:hypothetical protein A3D78_03185 [Candidatus Gottesmanbacteria bacterium RIFCSPHIGHO2_02_FULL_39_14]|uniref:Uncharacterized protein n=2 Tax=Candidatus Gottesmaniibacteriota TaxID=1752720 RepID=A0A1F5ZXV2_9BACT|nr:MAG: hypothetical protein A3D78_03185 [Candidatus Gottesmanbacteria bacterium RIFCSPHIGHO2_02_FULL_39_14]OGG30825.1 MAG: hypothetical protein A3I51_03410 [Candidatus Gottesmanbacteria bacterium RIFCSPLOWO2_02_FULL_38_8]
METHQAIARKLAVDMGIPPGEVSIRTVLRPEGDNKVKSVIVFQYAGIKEDYYPNPGGFAREEEARQVIMDAKAGYESARSKTAQEIIKALGEHEPGTVESPWEDRSV